MNNAPKETGVYTVYFNDGTHWWSRFIKDLGWQKLLPRHLKVVGWS